MSDTPKDESDRYDCARNPKYRAWMSLTEIQQKYFLDRISRGCSAEYLSLTGDWFPVTNKMLFPTNGGIYRIAEPHGPSPTATDINGSIRQLVRDEVIAALAEIGFISL